MVFIVRDTAKLSRPEHARKVIKAADFWAYKSAEHAIEDARRRHDEIIESAHAAYRAEQQRGYREGSEAARLEQAGNMIEIVGNTVEYFANVEHQVADLVLDAVRRIVSDYDDRQRILAVVRNSLAVVRNQKQISVRVNPGQVEIVRSRLAEVLAAYPAIGCVDVVADPRLAEDACAVESEIGIVEASMSGQLQALQSIFKNVFGSHE